MSSKRMLYHDQRKQQTPSKAARTDNKASHHDGGGIRTSSRYIYLEDQSVLPHSKDKTFIQLLLLLS